MKADTANSVPMRRPMHKIVAIFRRFIIRSFDSDAPKAILTQKAVLTNVSVCGEKEHAGIEEGAVRLPD
jgi:hypothetical protein